jgi:hypothetical protein
MAVMTDTGWGAAKTGERLGGRGLECSCQRPCRWVRQQEPLVQQIKRRVAVHGPADAQSAMATPAQLRPQHSRPPVRQARAGSQAAGSIAPRPRGQRTGDNPRHRRAEARTAGAWPAARTPDWRPRPAARGTGSSNLPAVRGGAAGHLPWLRCGARARPRAKPRPSPPQRQSRPAGASETSSPTMRRARAPCNEAMRSASVNPVALARDLCHKIRRRKEIIGSECRERCNAVRVRSPAEDLVPHRD